MPVLPAGNPFKLNLVYNSSHNNCPSPCFNQINISLAVFNMIPIPPLDGSQIFSGIMIRRNPQLVMQLQMYGPQILMGLILFGMFTGVSIIWAFMSPFVNFFMFLFAGM